MDRLRKVKKSLNTSKSCNIAIYGIKNSLIDFTRKGCFMVEEGGFSSQLSKGQLDLSTDFMLLPDGKIISGLIIDKVKGDDT